MGRLRASASSPKLARIAGSVTRRPIRSAKAASSSRSTSQPVTPSTTTSGTPPTRVATAGRPLAAASISTSGVPSLSDEFTTMSDAACHTGIASLQPANRTASPQAEGRGLRLQLGPQRPIADDAQPGLRVRRVDRGEHPQQAVDALDLRQPARRRPARRRPRRARAAARASARVWPANRSSSRPSGMIRTRSRRPILRSASSRRCSSLSTIVRVVASAASRSAVITIADVRGLK